MVNLTEQEDLPTNSTITNVMTDSLVTEIIPVKLTLSASNERRKFSSHTSDCYSLSPLLIFHLFKRPICVNRG